MDWISASSDPERTLQALDSRAVRRRSGLLGKEVIWRGFGKGSPLVLLHGGHGSWLHWARNVQALSHEHTVWVPDMPGFHDSAALDESLSFSSCLDELVVRLLDGLDEVLGDAALIDLAGFSFGGLVAARLAVQRGGVRRLALLGPAGHGTERPNRVEMLRWRELSQPNSEAALRQNMAMLMLRETSPDDALAFEIYRRSCMGARFTSRDISKGADLPQLLTSVDVPTLMLWGEHDVTAVPERAADALRGDRLDREWCVIPGSGHWVQYERFAITNALLARWFAVNATN